MEKLLQDCQLHCNHFSPRPPLLLHPDAHAHPLPVFNQGTRKQYSTVKVQIEEWHKFCIVLPKIHCDAVTVLYCSICWCVRSRSFILDRTAKDHPKAKSQCPSALIHCYAVTVLYCSICVHARSKDHPKAKSQCPVLPGHVSPFFFLPRRHASPC